MEKLNYSLGSEIYSSPKKILYSVSLDDPPRWFNAVLHRTFPAFLDQSVLLEKRFFTYKNLDSCSELTKYFPKLLGYSTFGIETVAITERIYGEKLNMPHTYDEAFTLFGFDLIRARLTQVLLDLLKIGSISRIMYPNVEELLDKDNLMFGRIITSFDDNDIHLWFKTLKLKRLSEKAYYKKITSSVTKLLLT